MDVHLGINTCFAVKRWPRPSEWVAIVRDELGLDLVQHSLDLVDLSLSPEALSRQAAETRSAAQAAGLTLHSTFTGLAAYSSNLLLHPDPDARAAALAWYARAIDYTSAVGAMGTGGHVGAFSVADGADPGARARGWEILRASLAALAERAKAAGQSFFLVENLAAGREPATMADLAGLLTDEEADRVPIRLCLDVGHMCVAGTSGPDRDPYAWLERLGGAAEVIQLQQSDAEGDHHWPFTPAYNALGRIEADRVLDALSASGAPQATLILEVIPPFEQDDRAVLEDLRASVAHWRAALERRGLGRG